MIEIWPLPERAGVSMNEAIRDTMTRGPVDDGPAMSLIGKERFVMSLLMRRLSVVWLVVSCAGLAIGQDKSVKPGVNDPFRDPDVKEFVGKFEVESREVYSHRQQIVAACRIRPGETVADIGAGTGLFTRLFSEAVGPDGRVIAVDIAQKFLDHVLTTSRAAGQRNVETLLGKADSTELPPASVDVAFICDTYHHFEFPLKTMASVHRALKPGGRLILVDFQRIAGKSSEWVMGHVRAGQEVFEAEVIQAGFQKEREERDLLQENYLVVFRKPTAPTPLSKLEFPIIPGYGGVVSKPMATEQPRAGAKVVFDITADAKPADVNKGLERAARLLNLYGASGRSAKDVKIALVLHGDATKSVLNDAAYKARFEVDTNPNLPLIRLLKQAGVEVHVCGQALNYKAIPDAEVATEVSIAAAALTVVINKQADGYAYVPVP